MRKMLRTPALRRAPRSVRAIHWLTSGLRHPVRPVQLALLTGNKIRASGWLAVLLALATGLNACATRPIERERSVGLFTTLPLLWRESESLQGLLDQSVKPHWAKSVLSEAGRLVPVDVLDGPVSRMRLLVLAQPRPLSPQENVALDRWVRGGGKVLLFVDPMLTAESQFALGDKRRPQDIALLSPILSRWGLELTFEEDQPTGEREVDWQGGELPVNLPGKFQSVSPRCVLEAEGLVARCKVGRGSVLALADAALLETVELHAIPNRQAALKRLISGLDSKF